MKGLAAPTIAGSFSLAAFAVAIVAGLAGGNEASTILVRALLAMVACYPVGLAVGLVAQRIVTDHVKAHREAHPAPDSTTDETQLDAGVVSEHGEEVIVV